MRLQRICPFNKARILHALAFVTAAMGLTSTAQADEAEDSFWLPGQNGSFAAIAPGQGWSMPIQAYTYQGSGGNTTASFDTMFSGLFFVPTYTFDQKLFGATPSISISFFPGYDDTSATSTAGKQKNSDTVTGFGDIYPTAQLFWNKGVHNWMGYVRGNIPTGDYHPNRLANIGLGHAAIDVGGAYTYLNPNTGWEASATLGFTYNFENTDTDYTSGIDSHLDVGMSRFLTDQFFVGAVGYAYLQLTPDDGQAVALGDFKSSVYALGPQIGYNFDVGGRQIYTNLRLYYEFGAKNRPEGTAAFLTVNIPFTKPKSKTQM